MGNVETMERVKCVSSFQGGWWQPWRGGRRRRGCGCESLRGMGSGILLVMYYTLGGLGKGVGVGGGSAWVRANIVTVPKLGWVLGLGHSSHRQICGNIKDGFSFAVLPTNDTNK